MCRRIRSRGRNDQQGFRKIVDFSDEWITTRTGIKERRILKGEGKATSDMGAEVVKQICEKDFTGKSVGVVATVTPDMPFPSIKFNL